MKPSTKNKAEGKFHEMKGKVKVKAGQLTHNPDLEAEGSVEKVAGKIQGIIGRVEKAIQQ
ncbi:MAG: CsbD family protein [Acidobacteriia bacterium]|nr:CsbD family protein [Terriglobia bacterium]